jgi:hypothetical protein
LNAALDEELSPRPGRISFVPPNRWLAPPANF